MIRRFRAAPEKSSVPIRFLVMIVVLPALTACARLSRNALTETDQNVAQVESFSGIRFWGDGPSDELGSSDREFRPPIH